MKNIIDSTTDFFLKQENKFKNKNVAFVYMLLSALFFSIMALFVKYSKHIPPYQVIYTRAFLNVFLCLIVIYYGKYEVAPKDPKTHKLLLRRGVLGGLALGFYFHSIYFLPLSIVAVLQRINPLWVGLFGALFYNEAYTILHFMITIVSFLGVIFIMKPSFLFGKSENTEEKYEYLIGVILALGNSILQSIIQLTIRELKDRSNIMTIVFYFNFFNLLFAGLGEFFENTIVLSLYDWLLMIIIGILGWLGQLTRARALFLEKAFFLSIVAYFQIIFSYLFDVFLLSESIDFFSYIGMFIIIIAMVTLIYKESKN